MSSHNWGAIEGPYKPPSGAMVLICGVEGFKGVGIGGWTMRFLNGGRNWGMEFLYILVEP